MSETISTRRGPVTIRLTHAEDAEAYRDLRLQAIRTNQTAFTTDYTANEARTLEQWAEMMAGSERGVIFVAEAGDQMIGMAGIFRQETPKTNHNGIIWGVYLDPEWRGLGIVDALIGACIGWARERGMPIVKLSVVANNAGALRAYLRNGFQIYGVEPDAVRWEGITYDEFLLYRCIEE